MHVDEHKILSISRELWANQLGLAIHPAEEEQAADGAEPTLASCINVSGAFRGAIVVECPESVARHAAAMLFAADGEETSQEDIQDALKELSIMIGKRMRTLLPETSKLSRPAVSGNRADVDLDGMQGISDLKLTCEGRQIRIALLEKEAEPAAAAG